jgi:hypothetical protein
VTCVGRAGGGKSSLAGKTTTSAAANGCATLTAHTPSTVSRNQRPRDTEVVPLMVAIESPGRGNDFKRVEGWKGLDCLRSFRPWTAPHGRSWSPV